MPLRKKKKKSKARANPLSRVFHQHGSTTDVRHRKQTVLTAWVSTAPIASTASSHTSMQTVQVLCTPITGHTVRQQMQCWPGERWRHYGQSCSAGTNQGSIDFHAKDSGALSAARIQSIETELTKKTERKKRNLTLSCNRKIDVESEMIEFELSDLWMPEASHEPKRTSESPQNVEGEECERIGARLRNDERGEGLRTDKWNMAACNLLSASKP